MSVISDFRKMKDTFFVEDAQSPLTEEQKAEFNGLHYFPEDRKYRFYLKIEEFPQKEMVNINTSTGDVRTYQRFGKIHFQIDGKDVSLTVYKTDFGFFLPFVDVLAGKQTYPAGRYLEIEQSEEGKYLVDFNMAYNPSCAYNDRWSCPITPAENRLPVAIKAGEMIYEAH